jgi:hypothetical protein
MFVCKLLVAPSLIPKYYYMFFHTKIAYIKTTYTMEQSRSCMIMTYLLKKFWVHHMTYPNTNKQEEVT